MNGAEGKGPEERKGGTLAELNRSFGMLFNIGYYIAASLCVGLFIGYQADRYFGTSPVFTLVFIFLGMGAGMVELFKVASRTGGKK